MSFDINKILSFGTKYTGLTSAQAEKFLLEYGANSRKPEKKKSGFRRVLSIVAEPMILILLATSGVYFVLGDRKEGVILFFSIAPVILIEFIQQSRTDDAIRALDKMITEFASVMRDGKIVKMPVHNIVPGDYIYLTAGDRVPADGVLYDSPGLMIDEAMLTGESVGVEKDTDGKNELWQGTAVTQGSGYMIATVTGVLTKYGQLGSLLTGIEKNKTPLQKKMHKLVRQVAFAAIFFSFFVGVILSIRQGLGAGILGGLTMIMSLIPEEFPIVFSVFLIMGVLRMTKQNVLVREMAMVETLGSATVICTDKTGTLTEGIMSIRKIFYKGHLYSFDKKITNKHEVINFIKFCLLSLEQVAIDPIEVEVQNFARKIGVEPTDFFGGYELIDESAFSAKTKMVSHLWKSKDGTISQYTAGAAEMVLARCQGENLKKDEEVLNGMLSLGLRVIAIATQAAPQGNKITEKDLTFVGFVAMSDPARKEAKNAIRICQQAGIRVKMITGDNKLTAQNIAEDIGLVHNGLVLQGSDLENMSPAALAEAVKRHDIFARVAPEQKYLIVEALQAAGEIVAMTGDGVNDAPALKKADIGIAMGIRGTEVARAAAGIILLDDNFVSIVNAVKEGRRIYENLRQAFVFLISFHIPIVGMAIIPILLGHPLVFFPIHIIFLELFCDPATVLGFDREKARAGLMSEPPRPRSEPLISPRLFIKAGIQGLAITGLCVFTYYFFAVRGNDIALGRTMTFFVLVLSQVLLITMSREWSQVIANKLLLVISLLTLAVLIVSLSFPSLRSFFHFSTPNLFNIMAFGAASFFSIIIVESLLQLLDKKRYG